MAPLLYTIGIMKMKNSSSPEYVLYAKKGVLKPYRVFIGEGSLPYLQAKAALAHYNPHKVAYMTFEDWHTFGKKNPPNIL